jgi:spermidine/putrescine ABC transporter ATP-binding subunit
MKRYGDLVAVAGLDLEAKDGDFLTLLGPSGCGKTTTLRLIAGFSEPTSGRILIGDEDVTMRPPNKREVGMVFQDYALFPHLTVEDNIGFGLHERGVARERIRARVGELLDLVKLPGVERRYPSELSGGQQQRIALARAVAYPPRVLLMDEPLGALDLKLREAMQVELRRIQRELRITTVYVTHDQVEAMTLSDRIAVMSIGHLAQVGTPEEIYDRPRTKFVAHFVGRINFIPGRFLGSDGSWGAVAVEGAEARLLVAKDLGVAPGRRVTLGLRPERATLAMPGTTMPGRNLLPGTVTSRTFVGNLVHLTVQVSPALTVTVELRPGDLMVQPGERVTVTWPPEDTSLLDED